MVTDKHDHALSGATVEAAELFGRAVEAFNIYRGDPIAILDRAVEAAPEFAMARHHARTTPKVARHPAASGFQVM